MFISFEGVDGSGKSTQASMLYEHYTKLGKKCIKAKEPGGTSISNAIREILLQNESISMPAITQLLLLNASRAENIFNIIKPAILADNVVICDRFFDSTLVYQGYMLGLNRDLIINLHKMLFNDFQPDITFLMKITEETLIKRLEERSLFGVKENWLDKKVLENGKKMIEYYNTIYNYDVEKCNAANVKSRFHVIDANLPILGVFEQILRITNTL